MIVAQDVYLADKEGGVFHVPRNVPHLDTAAWYALGVPLYAVYIAFEIILSRRKGQKAFGFAETISNLTCGLGTLMIGLFVGPWVLRAWDFAHDHVAPFPWPDHGWWRLPAAFLLADFCYYIYHRAGHRFGIFWSIHGIHHQHEYLNSSIGFRLEWLADPYSALFFGLMPLAGIDSTTGFLALMLLSIYALTAHTTVFWRPTWGFLITPAIHGSHHSRDARFADKNFGAMLGIWDRLFGTWLEPARNDTLQSDVPSIARTHDGVRTQWLLVVELFQALRSVSTLRERISLLTSRPTVRGPTAPLREDGEISRSTRVYVLIHFLALAVLGAWVLLFRDERPLPVQIVVVLGVIGGLHTVGGLLDGRPHAITMERARLALSVILGAVLTTYSAIAGASVVLLAVIGMAHTFFLSVSSRSSDSDRALQTE